MKATYQGHGVFKGVTLEFDAGDMKILWRAMSFLGSLPPACQACGSVDIFPVHRITKEGHDYYEIECRDCKAVGKLGQRKSDETLFYYNSAPWESRPGGNGGGSDNNSWESATPAPAKQAPRQAPPRDDEAKTYRYDEAKTYRFK